MRDLEGKVPQAQTGMEDVESLQFILSTKPQQLLGQLRWNMLSTNLNLLVMKMMIWERKNNCEMEEDRRVITVMRLLMGPSYLPGLNFAVG